MAIVMLRPKMAFQRLGCSKSDGYSKISKGLLPPFLPIGPRSRALPEHEVDAINTALIAGRSEEEIRALVRDLIQARGSSGVKAQQAA